MTKRLHTLEEVNNNVKLLNEMLLHYSKEDSSEADKELMKVGASRESHAPGKRASLCPAPALLFLVSQHSNQVWGWYPAFTLAVANLLRTEELWVHLSLGDSADPPRASLLSAAPSASAAFGQRHPPHAPDVAP